VRLTKRGFLSGRQAPVSRDRAEGREGRTRFRPSCREGGGSSEAKFPSAAPIKVKILENENTALGWPQVHSQSQSAWPSSPAYATRGEGKLGRGRCPRERHGAGAADPRRSTELLPSVAEPRFAARHRLSVRESKLAITPLELAGSLSETARRRPRSVLNASARSPYFPLQLSS
jgi:hypothetical protein